MHLHKKIRSFPIAQSAGPTLIEMLVVVVVIAIIGTLPAILVPGQNQRQTAIR